MRTIILLLLMVPTLSSAKTADFPHFSAGVNVGLPFILAVDGNGNSKRGNFNLGMDLRHWFAENINWGVRFGVDLEEISGTFRQWSAAPGVEGHWLPQEKWRPFVRFDVPVILTGAATNSGSDSEKDFGIRAGTGFAWKLGDAIGLPGMEFRYDFDFYYYFGVSKAVAIVGLDLFRVGVDYRF